MTGDRWARVKALFQLAVERPIEEREAFLAAATGDDEALRREVESLLTSDTSDESFLRGLPVVRDTRPLLTPGLRLGSYEIVAPIGAGAMGEVYRARDTKLNRDVALKVLPDSFAGDLARLARFTREAQMLAALNHPNIAQLHGLEESSGIRALVMELVDGDDLSLHIGRGAMPLDEALPIARQIAHALAAAHEQGIIHRDLKPANIKLRADGTVKVLDFGLAKAIEPVSSSAAAAIANSAITSPAALTGAGMILGTAAYMSPEQAKGRAADRRTDVWAFGVVLYEMLTGERPFKGDGVSDTLASVLTRQPDWTALPATTPPLIRRLLRRCLEKDRTRRLADMADARLDIDDALSDPDVDAPAESPTSRTRERLAWASALLLVGLTAAAMVGWATRAPSVAPGTTRTLLSVAPSGQLSAANPLEQRVGGVRPTRTAVALSPDGKTLVFGAIWGGDQQLYARAMDGFARNAAAGHDWWEQSVFLARWPMGRLLGGRQTQEGASRRRTSGHALRRRVALRRKLGQRRDDRVRVRAKRRPVACAGGRGHSRGAHDASAGRVQSSAAPRPARRSRRDLHDLERGAIVGRHTDRRAVP